MERRWHGTAILVGTLLVGGWANRLHGESARWYEAKPQVVSSRDANAKAADPSDFAALPGFQVERLFTVPKDTLGSWVCLTRDDKGRLLVSDQEKQGLCRITPTPRGSDAATKVEHLAVPISSAQGMVYAFGGLYLAVNAGAETGLYRARDTNGDDQFDEVVKLKSFPAAGEHGLHALKLSPDGKSIFMLCGDHTDPPFTSGESLSA